MLNLISKGSVRNLPSENSSDKLIFVNIKVSYEAMQRNDRESIRYTAIVLLWLHKKCIGLISEESMMQRLIYLDVIRVSKFLKL